MLKSTPARKKYTTAGCGGWDKYELWECYLFDDVYDNDLDRDVMMAILLATIVNFIVLIIIVRVAKTYMVDW